MSSQGLKRLEQFSSHIKFGDSLIVNENREYCYLSFNRQELPTKLCYFLWNKPIITLQAVSATFLKFITPDQLFVKNFPEYGNANEYGAFFLPLIFIYFISIIQIANTYIIYKKSYDNHKYVYGLIIAICIIGFFPASLTRELNIHRAMVGLYGISLLLVVGFATYIQLLSSFNQKILHVFNWFFVLLIFFYILQSQVYYFFVYTRSEGFKWSWRRDISAIYSYLPQISSEYDQVYDLTTNISPLYAGFYGLLSAKEIHNSGMFSSPDEKGWQFLYSAGKFQSHDDINELICKHLHDTKNILIITNPKSQYSSFRLYFSQSWNGIHTLSEIYSLRDIINYEMKQNKNLIKECNLNND